MESLVLTPAELEKLVEAMALEVARRHGPGGPVREEHDAGAPPETRQAERVCIDNPPAEVWGLAGLIDHTLLRPQATRDEIEHFAGGARRWPFATVCVSPPWIPLVTERLAGSGMKVASVVAFPFGAALTSAKRAEAEAAILAGAREIDMVMNVGAMKSGDLARVESDICGVVEVCHAGGALLKVILENGYLSDDEKMAACQIAQQAGADFVKTSTGFGPTGAKAEDVRLMRRTVGTEMGVKAAGGIRTLDDALRMLQAGATRLGTSASISILEEATQCLRPVD